MKNVKVTSSCGNVFKDLGIKNPVKALIKADIVCRIGQRIRYRNLSLVEAGEIIHLDAFDLEQVLRGKTKNYSVKNLAKYLYTLGGRI